MAPSSLAAKLSGILRLWALALALSVLLVAAGERWPGPVPLDQRLVWPLLVLPPLAMAVWLLARWRLPDPDRGESID